MEENEESVRRTCGRRAQQGAEVYCLFFGDSAALNASCPAMLEYVVFRCVLTSFPWCTGTSMAAT